MAMSEKISVTIWIIATIVSFFLFSCSPSLLTSKELRDLDYILAKRACLFEMEILIKSGASREDILCDALKMGYNCLPKNPDINYYMDEALHECAIWKLEIVK